MSRPVWPPAPESTNAARYDTGLKFPPDYDPFAYASPIRCEPQGEVVYQPEGTWRGLDGGVKIGEAE